jgi:hypothetical protein
MVYLMRLLSIQKIEILTLLQLPVPIKYANEVNKSGVILNTIPSHRNTA